MEQYKLVIEKSVAKDLRNVPQKMVHKILKAIHSLADNPRPHGSQKLTNDEKHRIRVGNYRVLYRIEDDKVLVSVVKVAHRKDVYR